MENISASKIVFLIVAITASIAYLYSIIKGLVTIDPKDYLALVTLAFGAYFGSNTGTPLGGVK